MTFQPQRGFDTERLFSDLSHRSVSIDKENHPLRSKILQRLQAQVQPVKGPLIRSGSAVKASNNSLNLSRNFLNMTTSKTYIPTEENEAHNFSSRLTYVPSGYETSKKTSDAELYSTRLTNRTQRTYESSCGRVKTENDEGRDTLIKGLNWLKETLQKSEEKSVTNVFDEIQFESRRPPSVNQFGTEKSYFYSKNTCSESTQDEGNESMYKEEGFNKRMTVQGLRTSKSTEKNVGDRETKLRKEADKVQRERMLFNSRKKQDEEKLKQRENEFEEKKARLAKYEEDLVMRENEVNEAKRVIARREKDFEELTKNLEEQSEDLMQQRMSYVQEIQVFNSSVQGLMREREEINNMRASLEKVIESRVEKILSGFRQEMKNQEDALKKKYYELNQEFDKVYKERSLLEEREISIQEKEAELNQRIEKVEQDTLVLTQEKEDFMRTLESAELNIKRREENQDMRELELDRRRDRYDDIDLHLAGIRLNEEVWQKKREIEVTAIEEEMKKMKSREIELQKKERALMKAEETMKSSRSRSSNAKCQYKGERSLSQILSLNVTMGHDDVERIDGTNYHFSSQELALREILSSERRFNQEN